MSGAQWLGSVALVVWFLGVGLLAHAVPRFLQSDEIPDHIRIGISMSTELVAILMAFVVVAWPVTLPTLTVMNYVKGNRDVG